MAKTFLVMKREGLRVQESAAETVLLLLMVGPRLDHILVCECESRWIWKRLFVDCFITSWAGLWDRLWESLVSRLNKQPEQRGPDWELRHQHLVTRRNKRGWRRAATPWLRAWEGCQCLFGLTLVSSPRTLPRKSFSRIMCLPVTCWRTAFVCLGILLMFSLCFFLCVNA